MIPLGFSALTAPRPNKEPLNEATFEGDFQRFAVLDVAPGSPAANAGVLAGDEIVAIDGTPFAQYGLPRLYARIHQPVSLRLTVRREGAEKSLAVALHPVL